MKAQLLVSSLLMAAPAMADIQGSYASECVALEDASLIQEAVYTEEGTFAWNQRLFADLECGTEIYSFTYEGKYLLGEEAAIDYVFAGVSITPTLDPVSDAWNENALCGLAEWETGVATDVTGLECGGQQMIAADTPFFDIIREVEGGIQLGLPTEELNGSAPEVRPADFDEALTLFTVVEEEPAPVEPAPEEPVDGAE